MSKQPNNYRKYYTLCDPTFTPNEDYLPRASIGPLKNRKGISELLENRMTILNLATKVQHLPSINEPTHIKQSPVLFTAEEVFITPRDIEADKENLSILNSQEITSKRTPITSRRKLMELETIAKQVCPFTLQSEDDEPSTVKNIVRNLQKWSVSPLEGFTERCMEEEFISPRQFEETSTNLHLENMTLLNKNKELMKESKQMRKEYEERIRKLEEQLALARQELLTYKTSVKLAKH